MSKLPFTFIILLKLIALITCQYNNPHFNKGHSGIVHLFEWKYSDIAQECEDFLGPNKYGAVQISPVQETITTTKHAWWEKYQPVSYKIISRSGDLDDFKQMILRCMNVGVRIYVELVLNHMADGDDKIVGFGGSAANPMALNYPEVPYTLKDFHGDCAINFGDPVSVRNCWLMGLPDLNQGLENVRDRIVEFLNTMIAVGVSGFQIGCSKMMWPEDLKVIFSRLDNLSEDFENLPGTRPFIYSQEFTDRKHEVIFKEEYLELGAINEYIYSLDLCDAIQQKKSLSGIMENGEHPRNYLPSESAVTFIDNHDFQRGHGTGGDAIVSFKEPKMLKKALTFMLTFPYGYPLIMSSYEFEDADEGPPYDSDFNIIDREIDENNQCKSPWVCEHRWPIVKKLISFKNIVGSSKITNWFDNGQNQVAFCRGKQGFVAINNELSLNFKKTLQTCLPTGIYCDVISGEVIDGECSGDKIVVNEDGKTEIFIPYEAEVPAIVIHERSKLPK